MLSKITDPNDYRGPGTGYALTAERRAEIDAIRQARTAARADRRPGRAPGHVPVTDVERHRQGSDPREVCIGLSPALGRSVWLSLCGLTVGEVLRRDCPPASRRRAAYPGWCGCESTIDVGLIGLTAAARLSGSGIGIGLQGKGTALIHRRDLAPLANLELFSVAPLLTAGSTGRAGQERGAACKGMAPVPIIHRRHRRVDLGAQYHARAVAFGRPARAAGLRAGSAPGHGRGGVDREPGRCRARLRVRDARRRQARPVRPADEIRDAGPSGRRRERDGNPQLAENSFVQPIRHLRRRSDRWARWRTRRCGASAPPPRQLDDLRRRFTRGEPTCADSCARPGRLCPRGLLR